MSGKVLKYGVVKRWINFVRNEVTNKAKEEGNNLHKI
jgi:hypothetical protein